MPEMLPPLANDATALLVHDVGNYIQIATSAIRLMLRHDDLGESHELGAMLAQAAASLDRAGTLIRMSRDPGELAHEEDIHLNECLAELSALLRYATGPHVRVRLHVGMMPKVRVNRLGLQNVLVNLAINARDAMPEGGILAICALLADGPEMPEVEIIVADTGTGMERDILARVFEPRFSTKSMGSGMGLASARQFIEAAGGRIAIDSIPGRGTAVTLRLPISS
jgi:signal transduction histidine kinase